MRGMHPLPPACRPTGSSGREKQSLALLSWGGAAPPDALRPGAPRAAQASLTTTTFYTEAKATLCIVFSRRLAVPS